MNYAAGDSNLYTKEEVISDEKSYKADTSYPDAVCVHHCLSHDSDRDAHGRG